MTRQARTKVSVPSAPARKEWTLQSRPFVVQTHRMQPSWVNSSTERGATFPASRSFGERVADGTSPLIVQRKLHSGPPNDAHEREADAVAAQVVNRLSGGAGEASQPIPKLQRLSAGAVTTELPGRVRASIEQARGRGQALAPGIRDPMERAFGADFGGVRIHADAHSDRISKALAARAFTLGQDIFFRGGEHEPTIPSGQALLAHELAHVVQQQSCHDQAVLQTKPNPGDPLSRQVRPFVTDEFFDNHLVSNREPKTDALEVALSRNVRKSTVVVLDRGALTNIKRLVRTATAQGFGGVARWFNSMQFQFIEFVAGQKRPRIFRGRMSVSFQVVNTMNAQNVVIQATRLHHLDDTEPSETDDRARQAELPEEIEEEAMSDPQELDDWDDDE